VEAVNTAIAGGQVPPELQDQLAEAAAELQNGVNCPPPPAEEDDEKPGNEGKDKGKGKGHGDVTTSVPTTTEED
jgi:hypothetical protein